MISPPEGLKRTVRKDLKAATLRGMALFEMALVLPIFILGSTALVDTAALLRTRNALKEAAQASVRCLTTTDSQCAPITTTPERTRQYRYFLPTITPTVYGNMTEVPATIEERRAPVHRFEFDAHILGTIDTAEPRQQYQVVTQGVRATKEVRYVSEHFGYFVDHVRDAQFRVVAGSNSNIEIKPDISLTEQDKFRSATGQTSLTTGQSLSFSVIIPRPNSLEGFGKSSTCTTGEIEDEQSLRPCHLVYDRDQNQLFTSAMFVLEGIGHGSARGDLTSANVLLSLEFNNGAQMLDLGGRTFGLTGGQTSADFVPRGAPTIATSAAAKGAYREITLHDAKKVIVPLDKPITFRLQLAGAADHQRAGTNASWTPTGLKIYLPTFTSKRANLPCQENSCGALAKGNGSCTTSPNVPGSVDNLYYTEPISSIRTACVIASHAPQPTEHIEIPHTGIVCSPEVIETAPTVCSPLITTHTCNPSNTGINQPIINGKVTASVNDLLVACDPKPKPSGSHLLDSATATVTTKRVTAPNTTTPITATAPRTTCAAAPTISRNKFPAEVQSYAVVTPIDHGAIAGTFADIPSSAASQPQDSLACLPTRELTNDEEPNILKGYAFLTTPHRDLGCARPTTLAAAKAQVEQDARYRVTFGSPLVTGRFAFSEGTTPDSCTPHTVSTPEISPKDLLDLGVFPEPSMPPQCTATQCMREFAGFAGTSETNPPRVNIAAAIAEAKAATRAYLPNSQPEDLQIEITPSSADTATPVTYRVTTQMTVPLSFNRSSMVVHVAHGKREVAG